MNDEEGWSGGMGEKEWMGVEEWDRIDGTCGIGEGGWTSYKLGY